MQIVIGIDIGGTKCAVSFARYGKDQIEFLNEIQTLYLDSKKRAKKFTPKKYRSADSE